jgi:hypothetical protein
MKSHKKSEAANAAKAEPYSIVPEHEKPVVRLHRAWLYVLAALIVIPWLIAGAIYLRRPGVAAAPEPTPTAGPPSAANPGPWGRLTLIPIVISPPMEYVPAEWGRDSGPLEWYFPGAPLESVEAFLSASGLTLDQIQRLRLTARPDVRIKGFILSPDPAMVRGLSRETRARLYLEMGKTDMNFDQANAFRFQGPSSEAWLRGSLISPETRQLIEPLIYRDGDYLLFADMKIVRSQIKDNQELQRLVKVLMRQSTVIVKLSVPKESDIAALAEYWGRGGRRTDLRPLLESVAGQGEDRSIDIVHVLPMFARNYLYRYPRMTWADFEKPLLTNCLWSALNFFNQQPDDRFLDVNVALKTLRRDYHIVQHDYQLGDIVGFFDSNGTLFHVASYLADGMVLSKNGMTPMSPWAITTVDQLKNFYRQRSPNPQVIYHRRNDL